MGKYEMETRQLEIQSFLERFECISMQLNECKGIFLKYCLQ